MGDSWWRYARSASLVGSVIGRAYDSARAKARSPNRRSEENPGLALHENGLKQSIVEVNYVGANEDCTVHRDQ
jgi:hypothetical protein